MNILVLNTFGSDRDTNTFYAPDVMEAMHKLGNVDYLKYERTEEGYEELKRRNEARHTTKSTFTARRIPRENIGRSNGENALMYFTKQIGENALYLLDEPENSLSAAFQNELRQFLEDSARFYGCQFILATHSPFLLSMKGAKIYDLDAAPAAVRPWTELPNVRLYHDFFEAHREEFER